MIPVERTKQQAKAAERRKQPLVSILIVAFYLLLESGSGGDAHFRLILQSGLCLGSQFGESFGLLGGKVRQDLSIEFDSGQFQAMHELRIVQPIEPRGGANANDPQRPEIALLQFASGVSKVQSALDGLFC